MTRSGSFCLAATCAAIMSLATSGLASAATIPVNITSDPTLPANDANCSLREAVDSALDNAAASATDGCVDGEAGAVDLITLQAPGTNPYVIAGAASEFNNVSGDINIYASAGPDAGLEIRGDTAALSGAPADVLDANDVDRFLWNNATGPVKLRNVVVQDGSAGGAGAGGNGGGISNSADLTLVNTIVQGNIAKNGGGISSIGATVSLTVIDSLIGDSTPINLDDRNIANAGAQTSTFGGGILAQGDLTVTRTRILNNEVTSAPDATFDQQGGGGIHAEGIDLDGTITDSTIAENKVTATEVNDSAMGGGVTVSAGTLDVTGSIVRDNVVTRPGGPADGAGFNVITGGTLRVLNTTISGNDNNGNSSSPGGAASVPVGNTATFAFTTITGNDAPIGPALAGGAGITIRGTIIDEGASACPPAGQLTANASNSDAGTSCVGSAPDSDKPSTTPNFGIFGFNGGPTETFPLTASNNLLIDGVLPQHCKDLDGADLLVDQRGAERPFGPACDVGSYERVLCDGLVPTTLGGPGNDTLGGPGFTGGDVIVGSAGNDTIDGADGADRICGGSGNDTITGGPLADRVFGDGGNDTFLMADGVSDFIDCSGGGIDGGSVDSSPAETYVGCDSDGDGLLNFADQCPSQAGAGSGCPPVPAGENPECATLRAKLASLNKRIKQASDPDRKAKLKKKRRNVRNRLAALSCP